MERRTKIGLVIALVCTLLAGVVFGGLAGGSVGYYLAQRQGPAAVLPLAQPVANLEQSGDTRAPSNVAPTVAPAQPAPQDVSVVTAVKQVSPAVVTVVNTLRPDAQPNPIQGGPLPFP